MFNKRSILLSTSYLLVVVGALTASDAQAVFKTRIVRGNAAQYCQSALPVFDVQIRKRPLAVQNEGTTSAYVTCAFPVQDSTAQATIYFHSSAGQPQSISCTGVAGIIKTNPEDPEVLYTVKSIGLDGLGTSHSMNWSASDFGAPGNFMPNGGVFGISCNLAPGMGVDNAFIVFSEDVGS